MTSCTQGGRAFHSVEPQTWIMARPDGPCENGIDRIWREQFHSLGKAQESFELAAGDGEETL